MLNTSSSGGDEQAYEALITGTDDAGIDVGQNSMRGDDACHPRRRITLYT